MGTLTIAEFDLPPDGNGRGLILAKTAPPTPIA